MSASNWMDEELQRIIHPERSANVLSDCTYIFNILRGIRISADVPFLEFEFSEKYANQEEALSKFAKRYHIPQTKKGLLCEYLRSVLKEIDGALWLRRKNKIAVISWAKTM
jgi:hypothetical protein